MEPSSNYTPLNFSPESKQAMPDSLKYVLVIGGALIGLALMISIAFFLNRQTKQQRGLASNQIEPTLEPSIGDQQTPTVSSVNNSFTSADAERLERALNSEDKEVAYSVIETAVREIFKASGTPPIPSGTTVTIDPSTFTGKEGENLGEVELIATGDTQGEFKVYLIKEENGWFIYAIEEQK